METYNTGNLQKYHSKNPLKRIMVSRFQNKLAEVVSAACGEQPATLLDAGCGEGFTANYLYDRISGLKITGIDYFAQAVTAAKDGNPRKIDFQTGDINKLKFSDKSFNIVIATEVLEHLTDPGKALSEIARVTQTTLIISVPNEPFFCLGNLASGKNIRRLGNPADHINHWTYRGFRKFLENNIPGGVFNVKTYNCLVWTLAVLTRQSA